MGERKRTESTLGGDEWLLKRNRPLQARIDVLSTRADVIGLWRADWLLVKTDLLLVGGDLLWTRAHSSLVRMEVL